MTTGQARVDAAVLAICERGCSEVNGVIERLSAGKASGETVHLSKAERLSVLTELRDVMAVYDQPCDLPTPNVAKQA